jgi:hypothetical protein
MLVIQEREGKQVCVMSLKSRTKSKSKDLVEAGEEKEEVETESRN